MTPKSTTEETKPKDLIAGTGLPKVKKIKLDPAKFKEGDKVTRSGHVGDLIVNAVGFVGDGRSSTTRVYCACPPEGPLNMNPNNWAGEGELEKV